MENKEKLNTEEKDVRQTGGLKERLARVKKSRWIRFGVVSVIFLVWVIWLGSWWVLPFWLLLADIYLTQFIPWTWWKKYENTNKTLYTICSWIDAIVFALVAVYFINLYLFQNYQIKKENQILIQ